MSDITGSPEEYIRQLPGLVATVCTTGLVLPEFASALGEMRSYNDRSGIHKVEYVTFDAKLVEAGRDAAVMHAFNSSYEWILQIDADAAPFPANALEILLTNIYVEFPHLHAIGAYSQLNAAVPLPTIDTGTGTWEPHYPGEGILPVIRTGGHFLLTKLSAFRRMGPPPWFRTRRMVRPIDAMREFDNFARIKLHGVNPLWGTSVWDSLFRSAHEAAVTPGDPGGEEGHVGEDSGFCDRLRAAGGEIAVNTNVVAGHVVKDFITPTRLREEMVKRYQKSFQACGIEEV